MAVFVDTFFERRLAQLLDLARRVDDALRFAGIDYRVVGGLAVYLYVEEREPDAGRLTRDIDVAVRREDLPSIATAVEPFGLQYRAVAGMDMLVQPGEPSRRRAVHLLPSPDLGECRTLHGVRLIPLADLVRMKLTSFRLKDQTHLKDLEEVGLLTPEIEAGLSPVLRDRLAQVRAHE